MIKIESAGGPVRATTLSQGEVVTVWATAITAIVEGTPVTDFGRFDVGRV